MRGRKPKPTALKVLHNNPGRRPLNPYEPSVDPLDLAAPMEIADDPVAAAEWARVLAAVARGHCTVVDRSTLMAYCLKYAQWVRLESRAAADDGFKSTDAFAQANKALGWMHKLAVELGFTPSSRSRILAAPVKEHAGGPVSGDAFTAFQRQRRKGRG